MNKNKLGFIAITVALLVAAALWGMMLTGTAQAQSTQPDAPAPGWYHDTMVGYLGEHMLGYSYGMQAGAPLTGTMPYGGYGMMNGGMMNGGMMGGGMMSGGMMGHGMMGGYRHR